MMKLSKIISGTAVVALSALVLSACGSNSSSSKDSSSSKASSSKVAKKTTTEKKATAGATMKDGTYKLEEMQYSHGYKAMLSMTVADGKITKTTYDYVDKDGKSKQEDASYESTMKKQVKTGPKEYIPELAKSFEKNGTNVNGIEVVSGATESSLSFKNYAQQLVQAAQAGDTKTIEVQNGEKMKDGTYTLEEKNYSHGYRVVFSIVVSGGKITESKYDNVDKDGKSKTDDTKYEEQMKKVTKVGPKEYTAQLNKSLVKNQTETNKIEVVSGATESSNSFILYAEQLINAAQAGNTAKITVDNYVYAD